MMIHQAWQSARPQYDTYSDVFDAYPQILPQSLLDLQPRLNLSLKRFVANNEQKLLLVNMPDALVYRQLLAQRLQELATPASAVITSESIDVQDYLGQYQVEADHKIQLLPGLFDQADYGIIMISANLILANPRQWPQLKAVILGQAAHALPVDPHKIYPKLEEKHYQLQCVITGDREQLAHLEEIDDMLRPPHCLFGELELEYRFEKAQASNYLAYIKHMVNQSQVDDLADHAAISAYLQFGARITEDQCYMPLSPVWHQSLLTEAMYVKQTSGDESTGISAQNLNQAIENQELRHGYLPHRALEDICEGQVIIETQGQRVGQVNGLTVVEVSGHPTSYGEPARISCVVHLGDGDVSDVEHKTELGGNLHAKGMMIMQAFLTSAMNLDEPLPFAASIVFEQSYSEVDGDSASMAELTALVSALSDTPVNQHIAVTGAVDQFGRVQAVGGLNQKIEGFFHICQHQGLTGKQGVILPKANLRHLSLKPDLVEAIKAKQFHLWSVESVDDAIPLLLNLPFRQAPDNTEVDETILDKIDLRIHHLHKDDKMETNWLYRLKNRLFGH